MSTIQQIIIDSPVPSTCAVMDWLKDNHFPICDHTIITLSNGKYGGIISSHEPDSFELDCWNRDMENYKVTGSGDIKEYHGMFRQCASSWVYEFYMPEVQQYYVMTI